MSDVSNLWQRGKAMTDPTSTAHKPIRTVPYPGQRRHKAVCEHCGDLPRHHPHPEGDAMSDAVSHNNRSGSPEPTAEERR